MVDLTTDENGQVRARLLDLVPGRSKKAYADWLTDRGEDFTAGVKVATLDPFHGYKAAIDEELAEATAVLDVFHVVALGTKCVDEVRRRVQQATIGHRGRKGDALYGIQNILRVDAENLTDKQRARIQRAFAAHEAHDEVDLTWQCAQQLRAAYKNPDKTEGRQVAERIVATFPTCPSPRSPGSAAPCSSGKRRSWPTSPPAPPTAAPRPSLSGSRRRPSSTSLTGPLHLVGDTLSGACLRRRPPQFPGLGWLFEGQSVRSDHVDDMCPKQTRWSSGHVHPALQITINGLIELHRRLARGFKNRSNYRLRMLLIGEGLNL